ncbi:hypothetical protein HanRHA438_Chr04g0191951 [Helianthus annuus]|nr:hypothetical protein HanRHA438_Chr04g0191951 [Helianthus annuus]
MGYVPGKLMDDLKFHQRTIKYRKETGIIVSQSEVDQSSCMV